MHVTIEVLPLAPTNNLGPAYRQIRLAPKEPVRFTIPVRREESFLSVWSQIEERYKKNYLLPNQRPQFQIKKLQNADGGDIDLEDIVGEFFEGETTAKIVRVIQAPLDREVSVLVTSTLRPQHYDVHMQERMLQEQQIGSERRRQQEEHFGQALEDLDPDRPVQSMERASLGQNALNALRESHHLERRISGTPPAGGLHINEQIEAEEQLRLTHRSDPGNSDQVEVDEVPHRHENIEFRFHSHSSELGDGGILPNESVATQTQSLERPQGLVAKDRSQDRSQNGSGGHSPSQTESHSPNQTATHSPNQTESYSPNRSQDLPLNASQYLPHEFAKSLSHVVAQDRRPHDLPQDLHHDLPHDLPQKLPRDLSLDLPRNLSQHLATDFLENLPHYLSQDLPNLSQDLSQQSSSHMASSEPGPQTVPDHYHLRTQVMPDPSPPLTPPPFDSSQLSVERPNVYDIIDSADDRLPTTRPARLRPSSASESNVIAAKDQPDPNGHDERQGKSPIERFQNSSAQNATMQPLPTSSYETPRFLSPPHSETRLYPQDGESRVPMPDIRDTGAMAAEPTSVRLFSSAREYLDQLDRGESSEEMRSHLSDKGSEIKGVAEQTPPSKTPESSGPGNVNAEYAATEPNRALQPPVSCHGIQSQLTDKRLQAHVWIEQPKITVNEAVQIGTVDAPKNATAKPKARGPSLRLQNKTPTTPNQPKSGKKPSKWTPDEDRLLLAARLAGQDWSTLVSRFSTGRSIEACRKRYNRLASSAPQAGKEVRQPTSEKKPTNGASKNLAPALLRGGKANRGGQNTSSGHQEVAAPTKDAPSGAKREARKLLPLPPALRRGRQANRGSQNPSTVDQEVATPVRRTPRGTKRKATKISPAATKAKKMRRGVVFSEEVAIGKDSEAAWEDTAHRENAMETTDDDLKGLLSFLAERQKQTRSPHANSGTAPAAKVSDLSRQARITDYAQYGAKVVVPVNSGLSRTAGKQTMPSSQDAGMSDLIANTEKPHMVYDGCGIVDSTGEPPESHSKVVAAGRHDAGSPNADEDAVLDSWVQELTDFLGGESCSATNDLIATTSVYSESSKGQASDPYELPQLPDEDHQQTTEGPSGPTVGEMQSLTARCASPSPQDIPACLEGDSEASPTNQKISIVVPAKKVSQEAEGRPETTTHGADGSDGVVQEESPRAQRYKKRHHPGIPMPKIGRNGPVSARLKELLSLEPDIAQPVSSRERGRETDHESSTAPASSGQALKTSEYFPLPAEPRVLAKSQVSFDAQSQRISSMRHSTTSVWPRKQDTMHGSREGGREAEYESSPALASSGEALEKSDFSPLPDKPGVRRSPRSHSAVKISGLHR